MDAKILFSMKFNLEEFNHVEKLLHVLVNRIFIEIDFIKFIKFTLIDLVTVENDNSWLS